jgi:enamine deaminase RidA (YjgF/YER057c/UK114 family)
MGLELPAPVTAPAGVRLPFDLVRVHGDFAYISGHGPFDGDRVLVTGRVGAEVDVDQAYAAARATGLSMLASLKQELGDLDRVSAWIKALGFVSCAEGFNLTPAVMNGFSDLMLALWGESGRHARSAIGAGELPFGMPVEVEAVVALG